MRHILVDGNNLFWRTACALPPTLHMGAEFGFLRSLLAVRKMHPDAVFRVFWDQYCSWRREYHSGYKGVKKSEPDPVKDAVLARIGPFAHALSQIIPQYTADDSEADDAISMFASIVEEPVTIFSSDLDYQQLVSDKISVLKPLKGTEFKLWDVPSVCFEWEIEHPSDLKWLRAYTGCGSDVVPGCGVPKKILAQLVTGGADYVIIEERAQKILTDGWKKRFLAFGNQALINYQIMTLPPPKFTGPIRCNYNRNPDEFLKWVDDSKMATIASILRNTLAYDALERGKYEHDLHGPFVSVS